jgi:hypothetical protein
MTQGLEAGGLSGRVFTSLFRSASGQSFLKYIANGLDVSMGQLKALAEEGELTSVVMAQALVASTDKINQDFTKLPTTFGENMAIVKDIFMLWMDSLNQAGQPLDMINQKIASFIVWLESSAGQQFFMNIAYGITYAASIIGPIVDALIGGVSYIIALANAPSSQAFFQSLAGYAQIAGSVISWVITTAAGIVSTIMTSWPTIEPIVLGLVAALISWRVALVALNIIHGIQAGLKLASAAATALMTGATWSSIPGTLAATAAQMGLNAAMLASPTTWIILGIVLLIGALIALALWLMKLWETNLERFWYWC